jgi:hypothetical protein
MRCRLLIERGDANLKGDFALGQKQAIVGGAAGHGPAPPRRAFTLMLPAAGRARPLALALPDCPENARMKNPHTGGPCPNGFLLRRFPYSGGPRLPE